MRTILARAAGTMALALPLALLGTSAATASPAVTAWDLGIATAVEVNAPGQFCRTAPQGLPVGPWTIIPKILLPPLIEGAGGVTVVCVPGTSGPVDVHSGIGLTPLF
ncbi:hypothetical protein HT102_11160 [Hoyosella sp. G463]|uniref:Uncharacterized protein n=1 Tax=Lolliginicoccus lacisalsi TaxID=2742202 RepID=A0A927JDI4_9ACTN|nr:hypothetical protein [Lolliginicoccus lacisalsi]MBD8507046.1 hypothetical protein [Lolliginicoccus lacisalsi]